MKSKFFVRLWYGVCLLTLVACASQEVPQSLQENSDSSDSGKNNQQNQVTVSDIELDHVPYGLNDLYGHREVPPIWWDRTPRTPQQGEEVVLGVALWREKNEKYEKDRQVWIEWQHNSQSQDRILCEYETNYKHENTIKHKYSARLGKFQQGDQIDYYICAGKTEEAEKRIGPYRFSVYRWQVFDEIAAVESGAKEMIIKGEDSSPIDQVTIEQTAENTLRWSVHFSKAAPKSEQLLVSDQVLSGAINLERSDYEKTNSNSEDKKLLFDPKGFRITNYKKEPIFSTTKNWLEYLTDGKSIVSIRLNIISQPEEAYYGFGMKYDELDKRGKDVDIYSVNWYTNQQQASYAPIPYYFVPNKYGLYVDSTWYSRFRMASSDQTTCAVEVNTNNELEDKVDIYLFTGLNQEMSSAYSQVVGKPKLPPLWVFGSWISANEWDKQSEIEAELKNLKHYQIPTSVVVLEAWSDENTFYIFNDAKYKPQKGEERPTLSDFEFSGRWPNPKKLIDELHQNGIRVLLWQIPVLKPLNKSEQLTIDRDYAKQQSYLLSNRDGSVYKMPLETWFGGSSMIDFTNPKAINWFLDKRNYLITELGIDGFKTDGGEFVWGKQIISSDGKPGDELRNQYSDLYGQAYYDYLQQYNTETIVFSRSGGSQMQQHPVCWVGDQKSTFAEFRAYLNAMLSLSMSGVPFVAADIAGFSGDVPSTELYLRAVAVGAFSPIMQLHSETAGDPKLSKTRMPWNIAERKKDPMIIDQYRYYANLRMNLVPYLYLEAKYSADTGEPLMRSLAYQYPTDQLASNYSYQYLLGRDLLVAPIVTQGQEEIEVYLPAGDWYHLLDNKYYSSGVHVLKCPVGEINVFVRAGSILPLNLKKNQELGNLIGNQMEFEQLTIRYYPKGGEQWSEKLKQREKQLKQTKIIREDGQDINYQILRNEVWQKWETQPQKQI